MQKWNIRRRAGEVFLNGNIRKGLTAVLLTAALLLTGCSDGGSQEGQSESVGSDGAAGQEETPAAVPVSDGGEWLGEGGCYKLEKAEFGWDMSAVYFEGDSVYQVCNESEEDPDRSYYSKSFTRLYRDQELLYEVESYSDVAIGASGCYMLSNDYSQGIGNTYRLERVGLDGALLASEDMTNLISDSVPLKLRLGQDGMLYLLTDNRILVMKEDLSALGSIDIPAEVAGYSCILIEGGDGRMYFGDQSGEKVYTIDTEARNMVLYREYKGYRVHHGGEGYLFTLLDQTGIYGVTQEEQQPGAVAIWRECGIGVSQPREIECLAEGKFLLNDGNVGYVYLVPAEASDIKPKKVLKLAKVTEMTSEIIVSRFNMESTEYMIEVVDYSQKGQLSVEEAMAALNMDMIAGNYPDILDLSMIPENYYVDKGLLADIYPFLDADADLNRENLLFLDKLETDGKLYYAAPSTMIETAAGLYTRFGDKTGWTLDEYLETESRNDCDMMYNVTKQNFLYNTALSYAAGTIDWEAGTCDFESEEFLKILEASSRVRENPEDAGEMDFTPAGKRLQKGTMIASYMWIDGIGALREMEIETGEKLSYIGRPTPDGTGGTVLNINGLKAVCSKGDQQGAWAFIKYLLSDRPDSSKEYGISVNKAVLERQVADAVDKAKNQGKNPITEEMIQEFYDLLDRAVFRGSTTDKIMSIIQEEAEPFFQGDKTAQNVARIIQSRVSLLVSE